MKNTFLTIKNEAIEVRVDDVVKGQAKTAEELTVIFRDNNVADTTVMCSSSIDFADEYGFEGSAHDVVDTALEAVFN